MTRPSASKISICFVERATRDHDDRRTESFKSLGKLIIANISEKVRGFPHSSLIKPVMAIKAKVSASTLHRFALIHRERVLVLSHEDSPKVGSLGFPYISW